MRSWFTGTLRRTTALAVACLLALTPLQDDVDAQCDGRALAARSTSASSLPDGQAAGAAAQAGAAPSTESLDGASDCACRCACACGHAPALPLMAIRAAAAVAVAAPPPTYAAPLPLALGPAPPLRPPAV